MSNLPIVPTQVTLRGSVGSLDPPRASQLFTFGPGGQGIALKGLRMISKTVRERSPKSAKNRESQLYAQWAHMDHEKGKCEFCGRFQ